VAMRSFNGLEGVGMLLGGVALFAIVKVLAFGASEPLSDDRGHVAAIADHVLVDRLLFAASQRLIENVHVIAAGLLRGDELREKVQWVSSLSRLLGEELLEALLALRDEAF